MLPCNCLMSTFNGFLLGSIIVNLGSLSIPVDMQEPHTKYKSLVKTLYCQITKTGFKSLKKTLFEKNKRKTEFSLNPQNVKGAKSKEKKFGYEIYYSLAKIESAATTRKAMPVQNKSPVRNQTTTATRIAGISTRNSLMRTIIIKPIITKITSAVKSRPMLPRIERTTVKRTVLSKTIPQINSAERK